MMKERWSASAEKGKLKKGPWTFEEDVRLLRSIRIYGEGRWSALAKAAGLQRCGKSCRLRWVNYLRPDLKRGNITPEEERMIIDLHSRWGNRWSLIAEKMPGRTDNEIKNYWRCHLKKKLQAAAAAAGTAAAAANSMHDKAVEDRNTCKPSNINPYRMMTTEGLQSQTGSNHSHSPSYGQNSSMNMDCSQTGPDTFALLSPPLPVQTEPKTELPEQHQVTAAAACSSSSLESDQKSEVAEEPGLPPLAVPGFLCRLGSGIPLIEELATLGIAAAAADHHQRLCNANATASEILLHHHPHHHHQQQHPHHNPHPHQQQPEPQDCCEFDSGIEIDLAGDSMLWSVYPFLPVATPTHHHHHHLHLHHEEATPEAASASVSASSRWFDDAMTPPPLLHPHHP